MSNQSHTDCPRMKTPDQSAPAPWTSRWPRLLRFWPVAVAALCLTIVISVMAALYPEERAATLQAAFAPRAASILKLADSAFASTLASFRQATATLEVLGASEFAKPRSRVVDALSEELRSTEVASAFATLKKSTFGELSADLPVLSREYGVPINITVWDADRNTQRIAPFSRPNDTMVAYYFQVASSTPKSVVGLDVFTESARTEAIMRSKALNTAAVTTPTSLSSTGLPSVQIYGTIFDVAPAPFPLNFQRAPRCTTVNETEHAFLGWTIVPVTATTLISNQMGAEVSVEHMRGVGEDVTDDPRFAWARAKLARENPCGERLSLPESTESEQEQDPNTGLTLGVFHHLRPNCRSGKTLFIVEASSDAVTAPNTFEGIELECQEIAKEVDRLRSEGLTVQSDSEELTSASLHTGVVIQFAGRFWSITLTTTSRWFELHPGPSFTLPLRILVAALLGIGVMFALVSCIERQEGMLREEQERRKAIRKRAAAANEAHSQTLSYVAHEVRNPAHVQLATAELMEAYIREAVESADDATLEDPALDGLFETLQKDAETLRATSQVTVRLVSDLLDLTKLKSGRLSVVLRGNPVSSLIAEAVERHASMADPSVRVSFRIGAGVPQFLLSDGLRVAQVLNNGLSNAAKFCSSGFITVCATLEWRYAPRSFFRQLTARERRERRRQHRMAEERGACFGNAYAEHNRTSAPAKRNPGTDEEGDDHHGDGDDDDDDGDDISTDPLGIIDVDGSGAVADVVSYIPIPQSAVAAGRFSLSRRRPHIAPKASGAMHSSTSPRSAARVFNAGESVLVDSDMGDRALVVRGDLPLNATAAPAARLVGVDPGMFEPKNHSSSKAAAAVAAGHTAIAGPPPPSQPTANAKPVAAAASTPPRRPGSGASVSSGPGSKRGMHTHASGVGSRAASARAHGSGTPSHKSAPRGVVRIVKDDAAAEHFQPRVSTAAITENMYAVSRRKLHRDGAASAIDIPTVASGAAPSSASAASPSRPSVVTSGPALAPSSLTPISRAVPAQGSSSRVVPSDATPEEVGCHVMRLPRGGKVFAASAKVTSQAAAGGGSGYDGRSQFTAATTDSDGVGKWLTRPQPTDCPLIPFQAEDGRWAMPFVVFRVVNTGSGLRGKTMQELFAPYSSGADEDPGKKAADARKQRKAAKKAASSRKGKPGASRSQEPAETESGGESDSGDGAAEPPMRAAAASRNAQATGALRRETHAKETGEKVASDTKESSASPKERVKAEASNGSGGFAARVRSTGLGLGIAARLAFSMGATIRLFDTSNAAIETALRAHGAGERGAERVILEGLSDADGSRPAIGSDGDSKRSASEQTSSSSSSTERVVTVFEVAIPVCPPARLQRAQDDIPDETFDAADEEQLASAKASDGPDAAMSPVSGGRMLKHAQSLPLEGTPRLVDPTTAAIPRTGRSPSSRRPLGQATQPRGGDDAERDIGSAVVTRFGRSFTTDVAFGGRAGVSRGLGDHGSMSPVTGSSGSGRGEGSPVIANSRHPQPEDDAMDDGRVHRSEVADEPLLVIGMKRTAPSSSTTAVEHATLPVTLEKQSEGPLELGTTSHIEPNGADYSGETSPSVGNNETASPPSGASTPKTASGAGAAAGAAAAGRKAGRVKRSKEERAKRRDARKAARGAASQPSAPPAVAAAAATDVHVRLADTAKGEGDDVAAAVGTAPAAPAGSPPTVSVDATAAATSPSVAAAGAGIAAAARPARRKRSGSLVKRRLPPMRVLLVDDDISVRDITARMLRRLGCSVDVLTDGYHVESFLSRAGDLAVKSAASFSLADSDSPTAAAAAAAVGGTAASEDGTGSCRTYTYDCIFLDIVMPRLSGDVVARRLTSHFRFPIPLFACSGNAMPADLQRYRECGFSGVAAKPFSLKALKAKLFEVAGAKTARVMGRALAAGKTTSTSNLAVLGPGPALSGLAESELFKQVVHHVLGDD